MLSKVCIQTVYSSVTLCCVVYGDVVESLYANCILERYIVLFSIGGNRSYITVKV